MSGWLRPGARVLFEGVEHTVIGLDSTTGVRLRGDDGRYRAVLTGTLRAADDFAVLESDTPTDLATLAMLARLTPEQADQIHWWYRHLREIRGLPDTPGRPQYDPTQTRICDRLSAKAAELTAAGMPVTERTLQRKAARLQRDGLWGLVDQRSVRPHRPTGRVDQRVVAAVLACIDRERNESTGTVDRLRHRVEHALAEQHGEHAPALPSRATFYRLVGALSQGKHTFGDATTRRSLANRPDGPFTVTLAARPGEQVHIDSSPLDVIALFADGVTGRAELTIMVDIASRTLCAAVLRPVAAKAIDAALLLARALVPEPMRPGWDGALAITRSVLGDTLLDDDTRTAAAAAKPVIVPETVVIDHGKVFLSETFRNACELLGISIQPAQPRTPTDKGVVEATFASINSLFTQYLAGYTGRSVVRRGADPEAQAVWPVWALQDLLDQWIVAAWQNRPHEALRDPFAGGLVLSPNEMYAALTTAAGQVPVGFSTEDYIALLPICWRTIQHYGVRINNRTYDGPELNPFRHQTSGLSDGKWEFRYDPYNVRHVWLRDWAAQQWITLTWSHGDSLAMPMADFVWTEARRIAAGRADRDEAAVARIARDILTQAGNGPADASPPPATAKRRKRVAARNRAVQQQRDRDPLPAPQPTDQAPPATQHIVDESEPTAQLADVIPFAIFDAAREADRYQ
jgi:transposase InsO family protein